MSNEECLVCHEDQELQNDAGKYIGVNAGNFSNSVHSAFSCTDCHNQKADYDNLPHFDVYHKVDCSGCHEDASESFNVSFHGIAKQKGTKGAPNCCACHGDCNDPHLIQSLDLRTAENSCRRCHDLETQNYDISLHAIAASKGKNSPGCISCHPTHNAALPPSAGAINKLCESCHSGAMDQIRKGGHGGVKAFAGAISCASCHDVHATHKPHIDTGTLKACHTCHADFQDQFAGSVHEELFSTGKMNCLSCHRTHQVVDAKESEDFSCGQCHDKEEEQYRNSAHRLARLRGDDVAANCADCHDGHHVLAVDDPKSPVNRREIPNTCGKCHTDQAVITSDYVRLPISLPSYSKSIHGIGWKEGKTTAVCSDCHGSHELQSASYPSSMIAKANLASTCGQCHSTESEEYTNSVHGRALAHGITDSPSCTDCHDEHLILGVHDPKAAVNPQNQANETCAKCHEDPEMAARYGLPQEVISSYRDSYHGWAIQRGGKAVATCMDCHNTHDIKSLLDPSSSIHPNQVVATCARCHENSNAKFAASYVHVLARGKMMIHDWVKVIYIILIVVVLGGMALHNLIIFGHDLGEHYRASKKKPAIRRMTQNELIQHLILALSFTGLALTGFALRFPDAWWVKLFSEIGLTEETRRIFHRWLAAILVIASLYHAYYLLLIKRGRTLLWHLLPRWSDVKDFFANMAFHLGKEKHHPTFGMFDYTQKAEYWALIWGTAIMSLTGFVLWFPDIATHILPAWVVRVCEVIHYYEAILAVSAIIIWHFFFVIFHTREYPMSWIWVNGRMPVEQWEHHHAREEQDTGKRPEVIKD